MTAVWNSEFEAGLDTLPAAAWDRWLWDCDLHDTIEPLNECHLLGFLVARYRARYTAATSIRLEMHWPNIVHGTCRVCDLSVKQLTETVTDLQQHWGSYTSGAVDVALDAAFHRFGVFLDGVPAACADDPSSLTDETPSRLTVPAMRRLCTLFCVLYRHLHLASVAVQAPHVAPHDVIQSYHLQAAMDVYYEHLMLAAIPPASRVVYKQDFTGMYHCVSQVVYFHYPSYQRKKPPTLQAVREGMPAVDALASALQLLPDLKVVYEDELCPVDQWVLLLVSGGDLYLLEPGSGATRVVWTCDQLWGLTALLAGGSSQGPGR